PRECSRQTAASGVPLPPRGARPLHPPARSAPRPPRPRPFPCPAPRQPPAGPAILRHRPFASTEPTTLPTPVGSHHTGGGTRNRTSQFGRRRPTGSSAGPGPSELRLRIEGDLALTRRKTPLRHATPRKTARSVSVMTLGCMRFAEPGGRWRSWTLDEAACRDIVRQALDAGINFFDTANVYSAGRSEEISGQALKDFVPRDEVVLATKVFMPMRTGPNSAGLSRKAIFAELEASLRRLRTDYIDLYQIHRWDYGTPIEETLEALHDAVKSGKVRYIGASSMHAWQFTKSLYLADLHGWTRFVSMQNHYNLIYREEEREMLPLCADQAIGVIPWSPLA